MTHSEDERDCEWLGKLRDQAELLEEIAAAMAQAGAGSELALQGRFRKSFDPELVARAFALVDLRRKGARKFSRAAYMWFDRQGLEQSTSEPVARHKALRFDDVVWDLCCGMGGDALALAQRCDVHAVDMRRGCTLRTMWNAEAYGVQERITPLVAAVEELADSRGLMHLDPDRRQSKPGRSIRLEDSAPPFETWPRLMRQYQGGAIKLSPAANFLGKFPDAEIELISLDGECKEATVWFGALRSNASWRATVLPEGLTLAGEPLDYAAPLGEVSRFVYDPDPAVVRSGLLDMLAERESFTRLDREDEYLTSKELIRTPFAQAFRVLGDVPYHIPEIKQWLRSQQVGAVEIKCRRLPTDVDVLRKKLSLAGPRSCVVILAKTLTGSRAILAERIPCDAGS